MRRGEVWWAQLPPPVGRRPVVLVSRDEAYAIRELVTGVPVTTQVRGTPREGRLERDRLLHAMQTPPALLVVMGRTGVRRAGLVNSPSPDIMGCTNATNTFAATYARTNPERLLPYGGVHARFTKDARGDVDRLVDL